MLERLTEEWTDPADATINEELEFEKQLWMRTALYAMTQDGSESSGSASKPAASSSEVVKILSLYEDHGMLISHTVMALLHLIYASISKVPPLSTSPTIYLSQTLTPLSPTQHPSPSTQPFTPPPPKSTTSPQPLLPQEPPTT